MISTSKVQAILENAENQQVAQEITSLLRKQDYLIRDDKVIAIYDDEQYQNIPISKSVIKTSKNISYQNNTEEIILRKCEHDKNLGNIVKSINSIMIEEDRKIFIDRYLRKYTVRKICDKYYLSQYSYYLAIDESCYDLKETLKFYF